jgi:hypothetical protein
MMGDSLSVRLTWSFLPGPGVGGSGRDREVFCLFLQLLSDVERFFLRILFVPAQIFARPVAQ